MLGPVLIESPSSNEAETRLATSLSEQLKDLGLTVVFVSRNSSMTAISVHDALRTDTSEDVLLYRLIEDAFQQLDFDFDALPLEVEGDSKIIRRLNKDVVVVRFKPTVYSYTHNRYGIAQGTEIERLCFTSEIFRRLHNRSVSGQNKPLLNAFLAELRSSKGHFLVERRVSSCNLEVRVKRYHVGSPIHRYKYTADHRSAFGGVPVKEWTRFDEPIVCFDWRHPLKDESGNRLADEPLPDDYAKLWIDDLQKAKLLANDTFVWLEEQFSNAHMRLIDICFFIDRTGGMLYGEISPDCMRVRSDGTDPALADSVDKDLWRKGRSAEEVCAGYAIVNERFGVCRYSIEESDEL